jgi:hypothetical protein
MPEVVLTSIALFLFFYFTDQVLWSLPIQNYETMNPQIFGRTHWTGDEPTAKRLLS